MLKRGDGFGRLGIGVPYFKGSYDFFRWWTWLLAGGLENDDQLLNTADVPGEVPIPTAHNAIVREFLRGPCDTLCILEDDHIGPQDVIRQMRTKAENLDFDVVCANYTNRRGTPYPMGWLFGDSDARGHSCVFRLDRVMETGTQEVDGAGLGLVLIRRWMLEAILEQAGGKPQECFWFNWKGDNSQDIDFYYQIKQLGARVGVDRDARIGHIGKYTWRFEDFIRWRDASQAQQEVTQDG